MGFVRDQQPVGAELQTARACVALARGCRYREEGGLLTQSDVEGTSSAHQVAVAES
jgi:hypothetical protein